MKYLVAVDNCFIDRPCGSSRVAWDILQAAREHGDQVALACIEQDPQAPTYSVSTEQGVRILRVRKPQLPKWDPRRISTCIQAVSEAVRATFGREYWDCFHLHNPQSGLGALQGLQQPPGRVLTTAHSPIATEYLANTRDKGLFFQIKSRVGLPLLHRLERQQFAASKGIHTLSQFTREELQHLQEVEGKITVIPHWNRPELKRSLSRREARARLGWPEDAFLFFTVRNHAPRTGIDVAIRAVAPFVKEGRAQFYVGGSGPLLETHRQIAQQLGAQDGIHILGRLSEEDLLLAYQAADMFLLPTRALECFGLIILEALSFGCPVLGTRVGAIPELMLPILPELLCPPDDVDSMQEKIAAVLDERIRYPSPEALVQYASSHYGREVITPRILSWIHGEFSHN